MRLIWSSVFIALLGACTQPQTAPDTGAVEPVHPSASDIPPTTLDEVREAFIASEIERAAELLLQAQLEQDLKRHSMQIRPPLRVTPYDSDALQQQMREQLEAIVKELQTAPKLPQESGSPMR